MLPKRLAEMTAEGILLRLAMTIHRPTGMARVSTSFKCLKVGLTNSWLPKSGVQQLVERWQLFYARENGKHYNMLSVSIPSCCGPNRARVLRTSYPYPASWVLRVTLEKTRTTIPPQINIEPSVHPLISNAATVAYCPTILYWKY